MDVEQRVHIAPIGHEYDRILDPIRNQRADIAYLLVHEDDGGVPDYHDELQFEIESVVRDVSIVPCDLGDVYAVLGEVTTIASRHDGDNVYVNVSGAGTIPAIGATIACMDVATDATAYYVEPETYAHDGRREPASSGVADTSRLPTYPIDSPTRDQVAIMAFLADPEAYDDRFATTNPKKKDLIEYARTKELSFIADRNPATDKGAFRLLDTHVVQPLEADDYVTVEKVGRRRIVELTEQGENAYRAFRHKIEIPTERSE